VRVRCNDSRKNRGKCRSVPRDLRFRESGIDCTRDAAISLGAARASDFMSDGVKSVREHEPFAKTGP
jgi:hypothetical protein